MLRVTPSNEALQSRSISLFDVDSLSKFAISLGAFVADADFLVWALIIRLTVSAASNLTDTGVVAGVAAEVAGERRYACRDAADGGKSGNPSTKSHFAIFEREKCLEQNVGV